MASLSTVSSTPVAYRMLVRSHDPALDTSVYALSAPFSIGGRFVSIKLSSGSEYPMSKNFFPPIVPSQELQMSVAILYESDDADPSFNQGRVDLPILEKVTDVEVEIQELPSLTKTRLDAPWEGLAHAVGAWCNGTFPSLNLNQSTFILNQGTNRSARTSCLLFRADPSTLTNPMDGKTNG